MRSDVIIIGGGHSALCKGIELLKAGRGCIIFSTGEGGHRFRDPSYSHLNHRKEFERLGGVYVMGDTVTGGQFDGSGRLSFIRTAAQGKTVFYAQEFFIATGSFFSRGLVALRDAVVEPIFGLDVDFSGTYEEWVNPDFYADQPFMHFGVITDEEGHPLKNGVKVGNLTAIGSIKGDGKRQ
ncbi:MAG: FAD-binding protein [Bacteroidales bacterium]|nr:FAD-binding protein [Candidatus Cacconaster equi]